MVAGQYIETLGLRESLEGGRVNGIGGTSLLQESGTPNERTATTKKDRRKAHGWDRGSRDNSYVHRVVGAHAIEFLTYAM